MYEYNHTMWSYTTLLVAMIVLQSTKCQVAKQTFWIFSSCNQDSAKWTRGSGVPLKSWWNSIVLTTTIHDDMHNLNTVAEFMDQTSFAKPVYISTSGFSGSLTWRIFGSKANDGFLYGQAQQNGRMSGHNIAYIYSDLKTAIKGRFRNGQLVHGVETSIIAYRCNRGLMELKFSRKHPLLYRQNRELYKSQAPSYKYEAYDETFLTSQPTIMDPLDRANIYLAASQVGGVEAGDGLFAKRDLTMGSIIVLYAGFMVKDSQKIYTKNMTLDERELRHKNLLTFNKSHDLDLPAPHYDNIVNYRASLGHKVNHSFQPNSRFGYVKNPRFGETRCLAATKNIYKGQEILVNYSYSLTGAHIPRWYRKLHAATFGANGSE